MSPRSPYRACTVCVVAGAAAVGVWIRRQAVLTASLAVAAALGTLSIPLDSQRLRVTAAVVGVVGTALGLVIEIIRTRLEGRRERAESDRVLRVPVTLIRAIDPRQIGVDPAAQAVLGGGTLPDYQPRNIDTRLREAIDAALPGSGPWLVVVIGSPKVGKSRALFEALRTVAGDRRIKVS